MKLKTMNPRTLSLFIVATILCGAAPAKAAFQVEDVTFGAGIWEVLDPAKAWGYSAEARFSPLVGELRPLVHATVTEEEAIFVGAGVAYTFQGESPWGLSVGVVPGYFESNAGQDLGGGFQILSFVEVSYRVRQADRISVRGGHISNASVRSRNPGAEMVMFQYSVSLK